MIWKRTIIFFLVLILAGALLMLGYFLITSAQHFDGQCVQGGFFSTSLYQCSFWEFLTNEFPWAMLYLYFMGLFWLLGSAVATIFFWFWQLNRRSAKERPQTHQFYLFTFVGIITGFILIFISHLTQFHNFNSFIPMVLYWLGLVLVPAAVGTLIDKTRNKISAKSKTPTI